jgi:hypothetical protein
VAQTSSPGGTVKATLLLTKARVEEEQIEHAILEAKQQLEKTSATLVDLHVQLEGVQQQIRELLR